MLFSKMHCCIGGITLELYASEIWKSHVWFGKKALCVKSDSVSAFHLLGIYLVKLALPEKDEECNGGKDRKRGGGGAAAAILFYF